MSLRIVGAGLGRTGTSSLREALPALIGGECYHMSQVMRRAGHVEQWRALVDHGVVPDWESFFAGYSATLDWPAVAYWDSIAAAFPDAFVLLSTRRTPEEWYASFSKTIVPVLLDETKYGHPALQMSRVVTFKTFTDLVTDEGECIRAYNRHNERVRASVPPSRLIEWQPGDGWDPLCAALGVTEPAEPFPHVNTTDDFRDLLRVDAPGPVPFLAPPSPAKRLEQKARQILRSVRSRLR